MKKTRSLVLLASLVGLLAGCQTDTDMTTRKTEMKLEREQRKLERLEQSQYN